MILFCLSNLLVIPSPLIRVLVKVPSYICFEPQLGLFCFNNAFVIFCSKQTFKAISAPLLKKDVLSSFSLFITLSFKISLGTLGVLSPPSTSGHILINS